MGMEMGLEKATVKGKSTKRAKIESIMTSERPEQLTTTKDRPGVRGQRDAIEVSAPNGPPRRRFWRFFITAPPVSRGRFGSLDDLKRCRATKDERGEESLAPCVFVPFKVADIGHLSVQKAGLCAVGRLSPAPSVVHWLTVPRRRLIAAQGHWAKIPCVSTSVNTNYQTESVPQPTPNSDSGMDQS
uniref:Uncharacterized protein n=1 Tax=Plectus sambesii TaxID=2011161 RepID=A0A914UPE4_9BILA